MIDETRLKLLKDLARIKPFRPEFLCRLAAFIECNEHYDPVDPEKAAQAVYADLIRNGVSDGELYITADRKIASKKD